MMTKCSWKNCGLGLFIGLLFMSITTVVWAEDTEKKSETTTSSSVDKGSNAAAEADVELFVGALKLGKASDTKVLDELESACNEAKKKVDEKKKQISQLDAKISTSLGYSAVGTSNTGYVMMASTKITDPTEYAKYSEQKAQLQKELDVLKDEKNRACQEADEAKDAAEGDIYSYTGSDGSKILFQYNKYSKTAKVVTGSLRGCVPLPMKLAEGRSCIFCPLFSKIFNAAQRMTSGSYKALAKAFANILLVGFALWVAFSLLGKVSSFTKMDAPKYITELLTQAFKVLVAFLLLRDATAIYGYVLGPLLKAGMEFGMTLLSAGENAYLKSCDTSSKLSELSSGLLPGYLYTQLECFIKAVQAELAVPQAIGSSLMCVSRNAGAIDMGALTTVTSFRFPDLSMAFEGMIIWVFAWLLSLAFAFYLVDATVRLGIVGALMPFLIASWPFKVTSKYTNQGFTMFMNTFFTYVFMGLVVSINIQLMSESMAGVPGGKDAIIQALNGNKVSVLKDLLDIGFSGFLILIASCIFGFKLCGQATELAGSMAGGGGGSSIAPQIGGMGYNVAKEAALGVGKMTWSGTKLVGNATGVTPKLRQAKDKVVSKVSSGLRNMFTFGKATSQSRTPVSRVRSSEAGTSTSSSVPNPSSGGALPVTPDQARQADQVENATPRTTTAQNQSGTTAQMGAGKSKQANAQQAEQIKQQLENDYNNTANGKAGQQMIRNQQMEVARKQKEENEAKNKMDYHNRRSEEYMKKAQTTSDPVQKRRFEDLANAQFEEAVKAETLHNQAKANTLNAQKELNAIKQENERYKNQFIQEKMATMGQQHDHKQGK